MKRVISIVILALVLTFQLSAQHTFNLLSAAFGRAEKSFLGDTSRNSSCFFYFDERVGTERGRPVIACNEDIIVNVQAGRRGAVVAYDPVVTIDLYGNTAVVQTSGLPSRAFFPLGTTANTFVATSTSGQKDTCSFTVTVKEKKLQ